jgi:hypothetical protein
MRKNVAGQVVGVQMVSATDGSAFTGAVTVYVTGDAGTQAVGSVGSGACTHEGNGFHTYAPAQAETNYNHVAFTFIGTGAVPATVQIYTESIDRHDTADLGLTNLDAAISTRASASALTSVDTVVQAILIDTDELQSDWTNGGRLDLILDARASQVSIDVIDANVDAILLDTAEIGAAGAGLTAIPWNAAWDAEVQSEVADGLAAYDPPTNAEMVAAFTEIKGATFSGATDSLEAIRDRGDAAWITATVPTSADIADAVWDEILAGHTVSGSTGEALSAAGGAGDPWITALPGAYSAGQAGFILGTNLNATVSSRASQASVDTVDTNVDAILVDTNELQTDWVDGGRLDLILDARASQASLDVVDGNVDAILLDTAELQADWANGGRLDLILDATATQISVDAVPTADENADALLKKDWTGITGEAARSVLNALRFLRNKWALSGTNLTVTKEDDLTTAWTGVVTTDANAEPVISNDPS